MRKLIVFFILAVAVVSCGTQKRVVYIPQIDSVRVEKVVEKYVHDTLYIYEIPDSSATNEGDVSDSSHLETQFCSSDAWVDEDGNLHHSLRNKPGTIPIPMQIESTVERTTRDRLVVNTVYKEVEKELTRWQEFLLVMGRICIFMLGGLIIVGVVYLLRKFHIFAI